MGKLLFLIHGRSFKPDKEDLEKLWVEALRHGIERDFGADAAEVFTNIQRRFIYYGDHSNQFLAKRHPDYDKEQDVASRWATLKGLKKHAKADYTKATYRKISSPLRWLPEFLADTAAGPANVFGFGDDLIALKAPDMRRYWNEETEYGSDVRWELTEPLCNAFKKGDDVMLIAHSLGTLIAYDVLWKFSYYGEYQDIRQHRLSHFVTLGSPLGNPTVRQRLKGGRVKGSRRYPNNVDVWSNVAAEDDYVCHDETVEDEYGDMGAVITDYPIYNLAVKDGKAHQHHTTGYLIHPVVAQIVHGWVSGQLASPR